ncbi:hypothetical protein [Tepidimonas charontis]|uniref:CobQ/CobB/MinD/ParA nucleotide binding domain-containing protein n=1 Tax=Tepidimonas charontis TaxID=2267262 RepID=A0A554XH36_9BURK|nr:hypothetical protein [Tepidimonas charontis]TSE35150.1 hypothetical protein Tchar_00939 [Tepidimonas charontis]
MDIFISHGEKGGIGKSMVSNALVDLALLSGKRTWLIEGDLSNRDVAARMGKHCERVIELSLANPDGYADALLDLDRVVQEGISEDAEVMVINLPAGAGQTLDKDPEVFTSMLMHGEARIHAVISCGTEQRSIDRAVEIAFDGVGKNARNTLLLAQEFLPGATKAPTLLQRIQDAVVAHEQTRAVSIAAFPALPGQQAIRYVQDQAEARISELCARQNMPVMSLYIRRFLAGARQALSPVLENNFISQEDISMGRLRAPEPLLH